MLRIIFLLVALRVFGLQAQTARTEMITVAQGLSQGMVFDILQGRDDFLWVATKDGLNRYDGYRFEVFSPDAFDPFSVASSEIRRMYVDSRGWIWLCYEGGIDFFVPETGRAFHLRIPASEGFTGYVERFAPLPDGAMWLATTDFLWKIEVQAEILKKAAAANQPAPEIRYTRWRTVPAGIPSEVFHFNSVLISKDQTLLVGTSQGLFRLERPAEWLIPEALAGQSVRIVGEDAAHRLWVFTDNALLMRPKGEKSFSIVLADKSQNWLFDRAGYLWNRKNGVLRKWLPDDLLVGCSPSFEAPILDGIQETSTFYFTAMEIDRAGNVWTGTSGYGLVKSNMAPAKFRSFLPQTSQRPLYEDPQGKRITLKNPWVCYSGNTFEYSSPNPWLMYFPHDKEIWAMAFDQAGNCWIRSAADALYRINARTLECSLYHLPGFGLTFNSVGAVLSAGEEALFELDPATGKTRKHSYNQRLQFDPDLFANHGIFYKDGTGCIWLFTAEGLLKISPAGGVYHFELYQNNPANRNSLSNNRVFTVVEDPLEPRRYLWVGTKGGGLNRLDRETGAFKHFSTEQGLPDKVVYGILSENSPSAGREAGHIWMSTNKGLCRFHVRDETVKLFTAADGLQDNEFNNSSYLKTRDGAMLFGGINGLTGFHPDSLRFNELKPRTVLTRLWLNNEPASFRQGALVEGFLEKNTDQNFRLELPYDQNLVTIEFAALEFTNPAKNQYRYQLIRRHTFGADEGEEWVFLGARNSVQFANLKPGTYTFRVLGSNNDGIWSDQAALLYFTIHSPWWATTWAYLCYALAISAGLWAFYRYQLRRRLEYQETLRLRELDDFKNRFFTNITHEFRTPLTVILGTAEQLEPQFDAAIKPKIGLIRRNGQNLLRLINQILDLAKLESNTLEMNYVQSDVLPYLRYIAESLHILAHSQNVQLRVESQEKTIVMDYDPERLSQIVYNLLSNAIKFTPTGGQVTLSIDTYQNPEKWVLLRVADIGVGIPPEDLPHIFDRFFQASNFKKNKTGGTGIGLALTKELVLALGGEISVESELGKGATFTVQLPVTNKALPADRVTSSHPVTQPNQNSSEMPSVLLVEDNPDVMEYLASCLNQNYQLDFAYNGQAGIEKALETVPDLIVSDVMMPKKSGFELCETLKNDARTSHIPIVLLTAKAGVEHRIAGLRRGADAYLVKPFHQEELLATLANLLEVRQKLQTKYAALPSAGASPPSVAPEPEPDPEQVFVQQVREVIWNRMSDSSLSVDDLSRELALSQRQLHRKLSALTGQNATQLIRAMRLDRARELLAAKDKNVSEVAYAVGFDDPKYFSRIFTEVFGVAPSKI